MFHPIKIIDIELSNPIDDIKNLDGYYLLKLVVRLYGVPVGSIDVPVTTNYCSAEIICNAIANNLMDSIIKNLVHNSISKPFSNTKLTVADIVNNCKPEYSDYLPLVTVAVCTRNRTSDLKICLDAIVKIDYPNLDLIVIDNAPDNHDTENLVKCLYPDVRYFCEKRPGLDWARNRAAIEAKGEIITYTDDDVVVDSGWIKSLVQPFIADSSVMAVTGLVIPYELETESQFLFETYGGFGRGFSRRWNRLNRSSKDWGYLGTGQYGTGANMAFRSCVFKQIGLFDPALDVGTVTNGGGDLEMYFRIIKEGFTLVYEPTAIVRHRHRKEYKKLHEQITNNGIGLYSYFIRSSKHYKDERFRFLRFGIWWLYWWLLRRLIISFIRPERLPRNLIYGEIKGVIVGLKRYSKAHKNAMKIQDQFGNLDYPTKEIFKKKTISNINSGSAVRVFDIKQPSKGINDVDEYKYTRVIIVWDSIALGEVNICNSNANISLLQLYDAIADQLGIAILSLLNSIDIPKVWMELSVEIKKRFLAPKDSEDKMRASLPADTFISIAISTFDRPDDLRECLQSILSQETSYKYEVIVVDNHPSSGLTPQVVNEFQGVRLINEPRQGLAYARNAGFCASKGEIIIVSDDDVIVPPNWLELLIAPFAKNNVMIVTGNVLPYKLDTNSQLLFETYGGLGRGYTSKNVDRSWFEKYRIRAVPTWELGATANTAFRAKIFSDPDIGLMYEALGPGMPTGVGEDTYLFYKTLKAGFTIYYEPRAYLLHKHRQTMKALRKQIYNYSKGHVSYHLVTLFRDKDLRPIFHIVIELPLKYAWRIVQRLRGKSSYTLLMLFLEMLGNIVAPICLIRSLWRVKKEGHSGPYVTLQK